MLIFIFVISINYVSLKSDNISYVEMSYLLVDPGLFKLLQSHRELKESLRLNWPLPSSVGQEG